MTGPEMTCSSKTRLILGCGYLGQRVAARWLAAGDRVWALTRTAANAENLRRMGIDPVLGDILQPETLAQLPVVDTVLWAVGWDRGSGKSQREVYVEGLQNALQQLTKSDERESVSRLIYISSTSVYGQSDGEWIDEATPCAPNQANGQVCLEAENLIRRLASGVGSISGTILRLSGIYGPGRLLSRVAALQAGEPLAGNPDAWLNLVHVDDAAEAVLCAAEAPNSGRLYLISDDAPLTRQTYYTALAEMVGAPIPRFEDDTSPSGRPAKTGRTVGLNKRCRNTLARQTLPWNLQFPTYREGLRHAVNSIE